jgi:hypothetical protein
LDDCAPPSIEHIADEDGDVEEEREDGCVDDDHEADEDKEEADDDANGEATASA